MGKTFTVDIVKEVENGQYELSPIEINLDEIVSVRDWSGEMDEGLESYGIDYSGTVTQITLSNGKSYLAACPVQSVCEEIKKNCNALKAAIILYICEKRRDEHIEDGEEDEYNDYEVGRRDGVILTLDDIEEILKKF